MHIQREESHCRRQQKNKTEQSLALYVAFRAESESEDWRWPKEAQRGD